MNKKRYYRTNYYIPAQTLRLLDSQGKQIGIVSKDEAVKKARAMGVDVVEIAPNAQPPVAKLIDLKKLIYQEAKKEREAKKNIKETTIKEIRLGPFTGEHDLNVRIEKSKEYFKEGNKVKVLVKFMGRQMAHPEFGFNIIKKFMAPFEGEIKVEKPPRFEGKRLVTILTPVKK